MESSKRSEASIKSDRVPQTLQTLFISSNRGKLIHKPPPNGVGSRTFRAWFKRAKKDEDQKMVYLDDCSKHSVIQGRRNAPRSTVPFKGVSAQNDMTEDRNSNISPQAYLGSLLRARDYSNTTYFSLETAYYNSPTQLQVASYGNASLRAVRDNDANALEELLEVGLSPNACNKHGESIVHLACRTGKKECLQILLERGCVVQVSDEHGRTPLHDAFFCNPPNLDIVDLILERDVRLLAMKDSRGHLPLDYVRKEYWDTWTKYFMTRKDQFWPQRDLKKQGVQADPELALQRPHSRPLLDPQHPLDNLELVQMVADGKMEPIEAILLMDDKQSFFGDSDDDDSDGDDSNDSTVKEDKINKVVYNDFYDESSESMFGEEDREEILDFFCKGQAIKWTS